MLTLPILRVQPFTDAGPFNFVFLHGAPLLIRPLMFSRLPGKAFAVIPSMLLDGALEGWARGEHQTLVGPSPRRRAPKNGLDGLTLIIVKRLHVHPHHGVRDVFRMVVCGTRQPAVKLAAMHDDTGHRVGLTERSVAHSARRFREAPRSWARDRHPARNLFGRPAG